MRSANAKIPNAYSADCPTRQILDRVGDKWAVLILILVRDESLERDGLIRRRAIATVPVTVEYSITPLGATLASAVDPLRDWAENNLKEVLNAQRRYDAQRKSIAA